MNAKGYVGHDPRGVGLLLLMPSRGTEEDFLVKVYFWNRVFPEGAAALNGRALTVDQSVEIDGADLLVARGKAMLDNIHPTALDRAILRPEGARTLPGLSSPGSVFNTILAR